MTLASLIPLIINWFKENWQGVIAGILLSTIYCGLGRILSPSIPDVVEAKAEAKGTVSGASSSHSGGSIEVPGRPSMPCPESKICPEVYPVRIVYDCSSFVSGTASNSLSASAKIGEDKGFQLALSLGVGIDPIRP